MLATFNAFSSSNSLSAPSHLSGKTLSRQKVLDGTYRAQFVFHESVRATAIRAHAPLFGQSMPAFAHPPKTARRHAEHEGMGRHVARHHRARAYHGPLPNGMPTHDGRIGPDGRPAAYGGLFVVGRPFRIAGARGEIVREHAGGAAEHVVPQLHSFVNRDVVLDLDPVADLRVT